MGVINLPSFYAPMMESISATDKDALGKYTSVDVAKLLTKFKQEKVSGVILDLHYNGGGSLEGLALTQMIGAVVGTLSSILLACPMLTVGFLKVTKQDLLPKARDEAALARRP